jgi:hypothetical protein
MVESGSMSDPYGIEKSHAPDPQHISMSRLMMEISPQLTFVNKVFRLNLHHYKPAELKLPFFKFDPILHDDISLPIWFLVPFIYQCNKGPTCENGNSSFRLCTV